MNTRVGNFAEAMLESCWLAVLAIVPLVFNYMGENCFSEVKVFFLRSTAVLSFLFAAIWYFEHKETLVTGELISRRTPMVLPLVMITVAYVLATFFSIDPSLSFWGSSLRREGSYSQLSFITFFLIIVLTLRSRHQLERLVTVILVASFPAALYGIAQYLGADPVRWAVSYEERVFSTEGNPVSIAAYLIMVVPLALMRLIQQAGSLLVCMKEGGLSSALFRPAIPLTVYILLLVAQLAVIALSQSRGPMVGLAAGLFFFILILSAKYGRRRLAVAALALALSGLAFLIFVNLSAGPFSRLAGVPILGRFVMASDPIRFSIWKNTVDMVSAHPVRTLIGYGPETFYLAFSPFTPREVFNMPLSLAADRAHNEILDRLATLGLLGLFAQLLFYGAFFYHVLRGLGLISTDRDRIRFAAMFITGGLSGWILPRMLAGSFALSGVGLAAGITAGMIFHVMSEFWKKRSEKETSSKSFDLFLAALFAAVLAHFVEVQSGFSTPSTGLCLWVFAALAAVVGRIGDVFSPASWAAGSIPESPEQPGAWPDPTCPGDTAAGMQSGMSIVTGLILCVLVFDFMAPQYILNHSIIPYWPVALCTWLFAGLAFIGTGPAGLRRYGLLRRWLMHGAVSFGIAGSFLVICIVILRVGAGSSDLSIFSEQNILKTAGIGAGLISFLSMWILLIVCVLALAIKRGPPVRRFVSSGSAACCYVLILALAFGALRINLNISMADIYSRMGKFCERSGCWNSAINLHVKAASLRENQARNFDDLGWAYFLMARSVTGPRDHLYSRAVDCLLQARRMEPLFSLHSRLLAILYRSRTLLVDQPEQREQFLSMADKFYGEATELSPNDPKLWNEWAQFAKESKQFQKARERLERARALSP